jgi:hypothetical protein
MALYGPVYPNTAEYSRARLYVALHNRVWSSISEYSRVYSSKAVYGPAEPNMAEYGRVWPSMVQYVKAWVFTCLYGPLSGAGRENLEWRLSFAIRLDF